MVQIKAARSAAESARELAHGDVAYRCAVEAVVLLANNGALPLQPGRVALYGSGGRRTLKGGFGSGEVLERRTISLEEGLQAAGFTVTSQAWLDDYDVELERTFEEYGAWARRGLARLQPTIVKEILENPYRRPSGRQITAQDVAASDADTCIYVLSRQSGEGGDRRLDLDYQVNSIELDHLRVCAEQYARTIVVLNVGGSLDTSFLSEVDGIDAVVYASQLGQAGGRALADILTGTVSPSGRLSATWARDFDDYPYARHFGYLGQGIDEDYCEGIYVGYRYFDTFGVRPAYPFGHGLSYTTFDLADPEVTLAGTLATVQVTVRNTGTVAGKQVVQLYASCPSGVLPKERQSLAGFAKSRELAPGEAQQVTVSVDLHTLASYDESRSSFILESGNYVLRLGESSRSTRPVALLTLGDEVVVSRHRPTCAPVEPVTELVPPAVDGAAREAGLDAVPVLAVNADAFTLVKHQYGTPAAAPAPDVKRLLAGLDIRQKIRLVSGVGMAFTLNGGLKTAAVVPGAAGSTTDTLVNRGIPNVLLADGPAGLRLVQRVSIDGKGRAKPLDLPLEVLKHLPSTVNRFLLGDERSTDIRYQYATAFPVQTALAQTWNVELLEEMGKALSAEMSEFGVAYWLAPGINIHRHPLSGRNYEYYSEDPYLSGKLAAAVVRGVQSRPGCYATVKHFVANEREQDRRNSDSRVDERALREIYLRPFEIAVREGGAKAVMTSYNKVNNVYPANSHELCTAVLREEWGFDGVVMTDWASTGGQRADAAVCMSAGNDMVQPGGWGTRKQIAQGLAKGLITEADLDQCAARVLRHVLEHADAHAG